MITYNMKYFILSVLTVILAAFTTEMAEGLHNKRMEKSLRFNGIQNLGKLNFDRVLSQWNKSNSVYSNRGEIFESKETEEKDSSIDLHTLAETFSGAFKKCIFSQKKRIIENAYDGKNIIFKCFRIELIKELNGIVRDVDKVSLLSGYVELQKIDSPKKKNWKVFQNHDKKNVYSHYYQGIFDEMFNNFSSSGKSKREAPNDNVTDTAFSEYEKYVIKEIAQNLEQEEEQVRSLKDSLMDNDFLTVLGEMSRKFAVRFNLFPGVYARMKRSQIAGVTFDLELDDLTGFGDDDDDDDDKDADRKKKEKKRKKGALKGNKNDSSSEEDNDDEDDDDGDGEENEVEKADDELESDEEGLEDGGSKGKGKGKGNGKGKGEGKDKGKMKKKFKVLKKLMPYLLIPLMIQAVLLPLAFKFLLFFAIKALLAGKIALLLVAINLIKNTNFKSDEDEYIERVGVEHYGYPKGEEYGAWINKRAFDVSEEMTTENHPYRAYIPTEE